MERGTKWLVYLDKLDGTTKQHYMDGPLERAFRSEGRTYELRREDREKREATYREVAR
jgi:hypothetical protein